MNYFTHTSYVSCIQSSAETMPTPSEHSLSGTDDKLYLKEVEEAALESDEDVDLRINPSTSSREDILHKATALDQESKVNACWQQWNGAIDGFNLRIPHLA